MRIHTCKF